MKAFQNQICIKLGYSPAPKKGFDMFGQKRQNARADNSKTYHVLKKAKANNQKSYLMDCAEAIKKSLKIAKSKDQFISLMKAQGFETEWKDNKKHIVFKDIKREQQGEKKCKTRLYKLAQFFPELKDFKTKENLLNAIGRNNQSDNRRHSVTTSYRDESTVGANTELIDFNSEFEKYSDRVDKERAERAAEETARRLRESDEREQERIRTEQRTSQSAIIGIRKKIRSDNSELSEQVGHTDKQSETRTSKGIHR